MASSAPFKGVHVEVISNGRSLPLYNDPDEVEKGESRTRQHYIEAVTGATFTVTISLTNKFNMDHCDAVRVHISFDGVERGWYSDIISGAGLKNRPEREWQVVFSSIANFCADSGQWKSGKLCFGELVMSKCTWNVPAISHMVPFAAETSGQSNASPAEIQKLGQIRLRIERVMHTKTVAPSSKFQLNRVGEVSEKVMKGKAIANTIEYYIIPFYSIRAVADYSSAALIMLFHEHQSPALLLA